MPLDHSDKQGGKAYGAMKEKQLAHLQAANEEFIREDAYKDIEDLEDKLKRYAEQFMEYDDNNTNSLDSDFANQLFDMMNVKRMMEDLGQAKTHLEIKKMIAEVDTTGDGVINYRDFVSMLLGPKSSVLKLILLFEERRKEKERPTGPPPKKSLTDLP